MSTGRFLEEVHVVPSSSTFIASYADAFAGTKYTDVFSMANYGRITFIITKGAGASGTTAVTVEACDNTTPSTTQAIAFTYRAMTTIDTWGAPTAATSSGFTTTAGADQCYMIEVNDMELYSTYKYVRMKMVEAVDSVCDGAVVTILSHPRYTQEVPITAIA